MTDRSLERAVLLQDLAVLLLSMGASHMLREHVASALPSLKPAVPLVRDFVHVLVVFVPTWIWCAERVALHRIKTLAGPLLDLARALLWTQVWGALALAVILMLAQAPLNRSLIAIFLLVSTLLLMAAKVLQRAWIGRVRGELTALVLGPSTAELGGELQRLRGRRVERLESLDAATLRERLRQGSVDEVVVSGRQSPHVVRPLLEACEEVGVPALVRVDRADLSLARPRAEVIGPTLYLAYEVHEPDRPMLLVKALLDRTAAALGLAVLMPVMIVVAALVKITSRGPVLFVQERGGRNGRPFPMLKFRTMRVGAEAEREALLRANEMDGPVFKMANDPRVTPFGRFLRRTSLDELPQLFNVLLGHMSLVGPRPLPLVETLGLTGPHRRRLSVRPGLTCLWQVRGRNELPFEEWMALDLQYIDRWSLGLDLAILLRTLPAMVTGRGAR